MHINQASSDTLISKYCYLTSSKNTFRVDVIDVVNMYVHEYVCVYECVLLYLYLLFICHHHCFAYNPRLGYTHFLCNKIILFYSILFFSGKTARNKLCIQIQKPV